MSSIGIMDGAFFVGRKEILDWINSTLSLNFTKIEQTAFGGVACQLLDIMHPGKVPLHKVNWGAKQDFEFIANYKILQTSFQKLKIDKYVDVDKLIKGKYQDNLEFMQWFKRFFEMSVSEMPADYDVVAQRARSKSGGGFNSMHSKGTPATSSTAAPKCGTNTRVGSAPQKENMNARANNQQKSASSDSKDMKHKAPEDKISGEVASSLKTENLQLKTKVQEMTRGMSELRQDMDCLEKERDFYFEKLRDIEMMLQDMEENGESTELGKSIFAVLYATKEGFEPTDESAAADGQGCLKQNAVDENVLAVPAAVESVVEVEAAC